MPTREAIEERKAAMLDVFRRKAPQPGEFITFQDSELLEAMDFGPASPGDPPGRHAFRELIEEGLLVEMTNALQLTEVGARRLGAASQPKYGARVYKLAGRGVLLVKQTVLRGNPPEYVIDEQRERHVAEDDDQAVASAVRDAVNGEL